MVSMSISYYHIDSFASELFAGNPAGVCLLPAFPVNDVMQKIAEENLVDSFSEVELRDDIHVSLAHRTAGALKGVCRDSTPVWGLLI